MYAAAGPLGAYAEAPEIGGDASGLEWLRARWADFLALGPRIIDLQHRAAVTAAAAREAGRDADYRLARWIVEELGRLNQLHGKIVHRAEQLGVGQLGAFPWIGVAALGAGALAIAAAWVFRRYDALESVLDQIEAGNLSGADAAELLRELNDDAPPVGLTFVSPLLLGALVVGGLLIARHLAERRGPALAYSNPPLSKRVYQIRYRHIEDGNDYYHDFGPGVRMDLDEDGSVLISHPRKALWRDFD